MKQVRCADGYLCGYASERGYVSKRGGDAQVVGCATWVVSYKPRRTAVGVPDVMFDT